MMRLTVLTKTCSSASFFRSNRISQSLPSLLRGRHQTLATLPRPEPSDLIEKPLDYEVDPKLHADHLGRQQNHIWTREEIEERLSKKYRHQPKTLSDYLMNYTMYGLYHSFNFVTGYKTENTSVKAMEWRLIVLESFAGVPGFVAAGFRHFRSLRGLKRDHGWIATLLEEAENERMHLLVCLKMFQATPLTRFLVMSAQICMTPFVMMLYIVHPPALHRFVGYLEETACFTYANVIGQVEDPKTELHRAWAKLPAPDAAVNYWRLPPDASFLDTLKCMFADESHHRDVNHTLADLKPDEASPFALQHRKDALKAWELEKSGMFAWPSKEQGKDGEGQQEKKDSSVLPR
eukprot:gene384-417_t